MSNKYRHYDDLNQTARVLRRLDPFEALGQELIDSVAAAVDLGRTDEIQQLRQVLEAFGLGEAFNAELRLSGVESVCNGECWGQVA